MWAALLGVLVGGSISVGAQWYVTPRVEARLRAEERWEAALVELHQLLTEVTPDRMNGLVTAWIVLDNSLNELSQDGYDFDDHPIAGHIRALEAKLSDASRAMKLHRDRIILLLQRLGIESEPGVRMWPVAAAPVTIVSPRVYRLTPEQVSKLEDDEHRCRLEMLSVVTDRLAELDRRRNLTFWQWRGR